MPSPSSRLTNDIIQFLFNQGTFSWRASSTGIYDKSKGIMRTAPKKGVSDILAVLPPAGRILAIEVKIGSDKLRPEQIGFLKNIEHVGGITYVAKDFDEFKKFWYNISTQ